MKYVAGRIATAILLFLLLAPFAAAYAPRPVKIRTITAFVRIDRDNYQAQVADALKMLAAAKSEFQKDGYEVQTVRITTQPFPNYTRGLSEADALAFLQKLDAIARKESFLLNIGPLQVAQAGDPGVALLGKALATTRANASLQVASVNGVNWPAVRAAARIMKYLEENSPNGAYNFDFTAAALVPAYGPFFPASNHDGPGHQFAVGWEAGQYVTDVIAGAPRDPVSIKAALVAKLGAEAQAVEAVANRAAAALGWAYMGLDPTPAPNTDSSIGAAIEKFTGRKFGAAGTLTAAAAITEAERALPVKRTGYSGLMLPILEDPVLARGWAEGNYDLDSLLAYSSVCGTGLDAIPLPGDVSEQQLEAIIGDMASLAVKWNKPLTARLVPAPGKKAGEKTDFDFGVGAFPNTTLRPVK